MFVRVSGAQRYIVCDHIWNGQTNQLISSAADTQTGQKYAVKYEKLEAEHPVLEPEIEMYKLLQTTGVDLSGCHLVFVLFPLSNPHI